MVGLKYKVLTQQLHDKMPKKIFQIPLCYLTYPIMDIEADSLEEAVSIAKTITKYEIDYWVDDGGLGDKSIEDTISYIQTHYPELNK